MNPNHRGAIAEANIKTILIESGLDVFEPIRDDCRVDIVVDTGEDLKKVQVKSSHYADGNVKFHTRSVMTHKSHGTDGENYVGVVDAFAVYCPELDKAYWVPIEDTPETTMWLRVEEAERNYSRINWAEDYEIESEI